jgi:hypothetical protein
MKKFLAISITAALLATPFSSAFAAKTPTKAVAPSLSISAPKTAIANEVSISATVKNLKSGNTLQSWCLEVDGSLPVTGLITGAMISGNAAVAGQDGCFTLSSGPTTSGEAFAFSVSSKLLADGKHRFNLSANFKTADSKALRLSATSSILSENFSLAAIAPPMTISGNMAAGQRLLIAPGIWGPGVTFSYQWKSAGKKIRSATTDRYLLTGADVGSLISVEVNAKKLGEKDVKTEVLASNPVVIQPTLQPSRGSTSKGSSSFRSIEIQEVTELKDVIEKQDVIEKRDVLVNGVTVSQDVVVSKDVVVRRNVVVQKEIANFVVTLTHDSQLLCSDSCRVTATAVWAGKFNNNSSVNATVYLKNSAGATVGSDSLFLSARGLQSDTLTFDVSTSSLNRGSTGNFTIDTNLPTSTKLKIFDSISTGNISVIRGPNSGNIQTPAITWDPSVVATANEIVKSGGSYGDSGWNVWNYSMPTRINVLGECMPLPVYLAPISLTTGRADGSANSTADAKVTIVDSRGLVVDSITVNGSAGGWTNLAENNMVATKVCGLNTKKNVRQNFTVRIELSYDAFDLNSTQNVSKNVTMTGALKWTSINCFKGKAGQVVTRFMPTCPEGWTITKAKVIGNKINQTTLNCLKGSSVKVITAPVPKCPKGFAVTKLAVKNGKLVPWSITCTKGVLVERRVGVFPSCPSAYTRR